MSNPYSFKNYDYRDIRGTIAKLKSIQSEIMAMSTDSETARYPERRGIFKKAYDGTTEAINALTQMA